VDSVQRGDAHYHAISPRSIRSFASMQRLQPVKICALDQKADASQCPSVRAGWLSMRPGLARGSLGPIFRMLRAVRLHELSAACPGCSLGFGSIASEISLQESKRGEF
jgi:hypothetical protein